MHGDVAADFLYNKCMKTIQQHVSQADFAKFIVIWLIQDSDEDWTA